MDEKRWHVGELAELAGLTVRTLHHWDAIGLLAPSERTQQALARRWKALVEAFTGGDPEIAASLRRMYRDQGPELASRGTLRPEVADYIGKALSG